mgnify:CR=1 FL=1
MYPDFKYLLQSLTGIDMPEWLSLFKTFGFLVAMSFLAAAWAIGSELRRMPSVISVDIGQNTQRCSVRWNQRRPGVDAS